jgi:hypothetical protein
LLAGVISCTLTMTAGSAAVKPGEDFVEPVLFIFGPPVYVILANLCYTLGPLVNIGVSDTPSQGLFRAGYGFSMLLTLAPGLWAVVAWAT